MAINYCFEKGVCCDRVAASGYCAQTACTRVFNHNKKTNGDRIRAMSDEELADWAINKALNIGKCYTDSRLGLLDWLQQPAEESTEKLIEDLHITCAGNQYNL